MEVFVKKRTKAEAERFYRQLLAEQRMSGLSIRAFAKSRGLPAGTLSSWSFQLRKRDAARRGKSKKAAKPSFVPVSVVDATAPASSVGSGAPTCPRGGYEIELGAGRVLRLPADFDDARVMALVRAVASC